MNVFINAVEGLAGIIGGVWLYKYYDGQLKYENEQEERRKENVKKHGWAILLCACICFFVGLLMFIGSFASLLI